MADPKLQNLAYLSLGFIGSFIGILSSGAFLSVFYYPHFWFYTAFTVINKNLLNLELIKKVDSSNILVIK